MGRSWLHGRSRDPPILKGPWVFNGPGVCTLVLVKVEGDARPMLQSSSLPLLVVILDLASLAPPHVVFLHFS